MLRGPSVPEGQEVSASPGEPLRISGLHAAGVHFVEDLRLILADGTSIPATPSTVTINVIDQLLVTQVTSRPLTLEEIRQRRIEYDADSFQVFSFAFAVTTASKVVNVDLPVLVPTKEGLTARFPGDGDPLEGLPELVDAGFTFQPITLKLVGGGGGKVPPIPGIIVIPGNIAFLNQFFSVMLVVSNRAPDGTPLMVHDLKADIRLPSGRDGVLGDMGRDPPYAPGDPEYDNPLRIAKTAEGRLSRRPVRTAGADGIAGTADDGNELWPGQSGSAEFLVEGIREGAHLIDIAIEGTLEGVPGGAVKVAGEARGSVVVRDPDFFLTFFHPDVVRAGTSYDLVVSLQNTGEAPANLVSVTLDPRNMSGARLLNAGDVTQQIDTIPAGESSSVTFKLEALRTGRVNASTLELEGAGGIVTGKRISLTMGVSEQGVPLSPDTLILAPSATTLREAARNDDLTFRALALLGEAYSVATAAPGRLPAGMRTISRSTVVQHARELSSAGHRLELHQRPDSKGAAEMHPDALLLTVEDLYVDFLGARRDEQGWDVLYRRSRQARLFGAAVGDIATREAQSRGVTDLVALQRHWADTEAYRGGLVSVLTQADGQAAVTLRVTDSFGRTLAPGADAVTGSFEIPAADAIGLGRAGLGSGHLATLLRPATTPYTVTLQGTRAGSFDFAVVVPTTSGELQHLVYRSLPVAAGETLVASVTPGGPNPVVLRRGASTLNPSEHLPIAARPPTVLGITQQADPSRDAFGRLVGVLFDQDVDLLTAERAANYAVGTVEIPLVPAPSLQDANVALGARRQFGDRIVYVAVRDPVGPFVQRKMDVTGVKDTAGLEMLPAMAVPVLADPDRGAGAQVTGRVRNADGLPVAGAEVTYHHKKRSFGFCIYYEISQKTTDADGGYAFDFILQDPPNCDGEPFKLEFRDPVTGEGATIETRARADGERLVLDAVLLGRGSVRGTVRAPDGTPLANARVRLVSETDLSERTARTDQRGAYRFDAVPVGAIGLEAILSSGPRRGSVRASSTVPSRLSVVTIDLVVSGPADGVLTGIVQQPDGTPVANMPVFLGDASRVLLDRTTTDASGLFRFERVAVGEVIARALDKAAGVTGDARTTVTASHSETSPAFVAIVLKGSGRVSGTVTRRSGNTSVPVPSATVRVGGRLTTADTAGRFAVDGVPVGVVSVRATDPVSGDEGTRDLTLAHAGAHASGIEVVIEPTGVITGRVLDPDGAPAVGITVNLIIGGGPVGDSDFYALKPTRTDAEGRYRFRDVDFGQHTITASRGREAANGTAWLSRLVPSTTLDLRLERPLGRVSGRVVDESGMAVAAEVTVRARVPDSGGLLRFRTAATVVSDPDRGFVIDRLYPGPYTVTASSFFSQGGAAATASGTLPSASPVAEGITLVLTNNRARLHGCLSAPDGTPLAPILDANGVPRELSVFITSPRLRDELKRDPLNTEPEGIRADASSGCYRSPIHLPPDLFRVDVTDTRPGSPTFGLRGQTTLDLTKATDSTADVRLLGLGTLLVDVVDASGRALPGAIVDVQRTTFPNDSGRDVVTGTPTVQPARFENLTEGAVSISARISSDPADDVGGRDDLRGFGGRAIGVVRRGAEERVRVVIDAAGRVAGRVLRPDGLTLVPNAQVELRAPGHPTGFDVSDADGAFSFEGVPRGTFDLLVFEAATARRARVSGTLSRDGEVVLQDVRLGALGVVEGVLLDSDGLNAIGGAEIALEHLATPGRVRHVTTDASGTFAFASVPEGALRVTATSASGLTANATASIAREGDVASLTMLLEGSGRLEGTVVDASGAPVPLATVTVTDASGRARLLQAGPAGPTAGRFSVDVVPLGAFTVTARPLGALTPGDGGETRGTIDAPGTSTSVQVRLEGTVAVAVRVDGAVGGSAVEVALVSRGVFGGRAVPARFENGAYMFDQVPRAAFTVSARQLTPVGALISASQTTDIGELPPAGGRVDAVLTLTRTGVVRGTLLGEDGLVSGARVTLRAGSVNILTVTDTAGAFEFVGVPLDVAVRIDAINAEGDPGVFVGRIDVDGSLRDSIGAVLPAVAMRLDAGPPEVSSITPPSGTVGVAADARLVVRFSEPIDGSSLRTCDGLNAASFVNVRLVTSTGTLPALNAPGNVCDDANVVPLMLSLSSDGLTLTLTPKQPLTGATQHVLAISGGEIGSSGVLVSGITDLVGRALAADATTTFVTRDTVAPTVTLVSPAPGAVNVPTDSLVRVTFSEPIAASTLTSASLEVSGPDGAVRGVRSLILGNTAVVFTPTDPSGQRALFASEASYRVQLAGLADLAGNVMDPVVTTFRTPDATAPTVTSLTAPAEVRAGEPVLLVARTADTDVAFVEFLMDGAKVATASSPENAGEYRATVTMPERDIVVAARATDLTGNVGLPSAPQTVRLLARPPQITSVSPASVGQGTRVLLSITGSDTSFRQGVSTVSAGQLIAIRSVTVSSPTALVVDMIVFAGTAVGDRVITVTTGPEIVTAPLRVDLRTSTVVVTVKRGAVPQVDVPLRLSWDQTFGNTTTTETYGRSTGIDGTVTFPPVPWGPFTVEATDPRDPSVVVRGSGVSEPLKTAEVTIALPSTGTVTGVVTRMLGGAEIPADFASVAVYSAIDEPPVKTAITDALGRYTIAGVPAGRFHVYAADERWATSGAISYASDVITTTGQSVVANLRLRPGGRLRISVRDQADLPVSGAVVVATPTGQPAPAAGFDPAAARTFVTTGTGTLDVTAFPAGPATVRATLGGAATSTSVVLAEAGTLEVTLVLGSTTTSFGPVFTVRNGAEATTLPEGTRTVLSPTFLVRNGDVTAEDGVPTGRREASSTAFSVANVATQLPAGQRETASPVFTVTNGGVTVPMGGHVTSFVFTALNKLPAGSDGLPPGFRTALGPVFTVSNGSLTQQWRNETFSVVFSVANRVFAPSTGSIVTIADGAPLVTLPSRTRSEARAPAPSTKVHDDELAAVGTLWLDPPIPVRGEVATLHAWLSPLLGLQQTSVEVDGVIVGVNDGASFAVPFRVPDAATFTVKVSGTMSDGSLVELHTITVETESLVARSRQEEMFARLFDPRGRRRSGRPLDVPWVSLASKTGYAR